MPHRSITKAQRLREAQAQLDATLQRTGYRKRRRPTRALQMEVPVRPPTSDCIPGNGSKREAMRYTGDEIAGIALNHKQNYEPIRRDNLQAAVDSAQMRRN